MTLPEVDASHCYLVDARHAWCTLIRPPPDPERFDSHLRIESLYLRATPVGVGGGVRLEELNPSHLNTLQPPRGPT